MPRCGRPTRKGIPCQVPLRGGKCVTHDADLPARNRAVRAAFARNDPERYQAQQQLFKGRSGPLHPTWKGDQAKRKSGRTRARRLYMAKACKRCGATAESSGKPLHRHHKDGDPLNNAPGNVEILCEGCHVAAHNGTYQWFAEAMQKANAVVTE